MYAYVTKGKGILGSGGQYNKQQRKMCMPFFQTAPILERYSQVVVDRCDPKRSLKCLPDVAMATLRYTRIHTGTHTTLPHRHRRLAHDRLFACSYGVGAVPDA